MNRSAFILNNIIIQILSFTYYRYYSMNIIFVDTQLELDLTHHGNLKDNYRALLFISCLYPKQFIDMNYRKSPYLFSYGYSICSRPEIDYNNQYWRVNSWQLFWTLSKRNIYIN